MKQLELILTLEEYDDEEYPYLVTADTKEGPSCTSWFLGKTPQEAMARFFDGIGEPNLKCWLLLEGQL